MGKKHAPKRFSVKASYSVAELAKWAGMSRCVTLTLLKSEGVTFARRGRVIVVYLADVRRNAPDLWQSVLDRHHLIRLAEGR